MKPLFLLLACILTASPLMAQMTLTASVTPSPGDTQTWFTCDTSGVSEGNAGGGQTWNFGALTKNQAGSMKWLASSATPYAASFPASNLAATSDDSTFNYYTATASSISADGFAGSQLSIAYTNSQTYMRFPFAYNDGFTDDFAVTFSAQGIQMQRNGTVTSTADAWGSVTTPLGTFANALRIRSVIAIQDSAIGGIPIKMLTPPTAYVWFAPGRKFPVMEISYTTTSFNGIPQSRSKIVHYNTNSGATGIGSIASIPADQPRLSPNFPNPFTGTTNIEYALPSDGPVRLEVYNSQGFPVATLADHAAKAGVYKIRWDASWLPSGVYFMRLFTKSATVERGILNLNLMPRARNAKDGC